MDFLARKERLARGQQEVAAKSSTAPGPAIVPPAPPEVADYLEQGEQIKADYQIAKLVAQTKSLEIQNDTKLKKLVLREFVDQVIGRIASVMSSHLLTMGDRVSPEIAASCGRHDPEAKVAVKTIIDKDVSRSIEALKAEIDREYESHIAE